MTDDDTIQSSKVILSGIRLSQPTVPKYAKINALVYYLSEFLIYRKLNPGGE